MPIETASPLPETTLLVRRAQNGDTEAFSPLVARFQNSIYALAYHFVGSFETARDVTQEAFISAFLHLGELRDPERFPVWLRQITANVCRQWLRHSAPMRTRTVPLEEAMTLASNRTTDFAADSLVLRDALAVLSEETRLTLLLYYFDGYSVGEVAAFLEVTPAAIKSRLRDARTRLRKELLIMLEETTQEATLPASFPEEVVRRLLDAARSGDTGTVRGLLDHDSRLIFVRQDYPPLRTVVSPVMAAISSNQAEVFDLLSAKGAIADLSAPEAHWSLEAAAFHQNRDMVDRLLETGTPLTIHAASRLGDAETIARFLSADPQSVQVKGVDGETPLHCATTIAVAKLLIDAGANLEARDAVYKALHLNTTRVPRCSISVPI